MSLVYRAFIITLILYDYVIGSSDDELTGNIISESESGRDAELSKTDGLSDTNSDVDAPDTNENKLSENTINALPDTERANIYQWHNGIVPYFIDTNIYDDIIVDRIRRSMDRIESVSCLLFKRLYSEPNPSDYGISWLHVTNPNKERDCVHGIKAGRLGEPMMILGFDCMRETEITHTLLHMLGFNDEVQHPQRDQYVRIQWDNIQPKYRSLFSIRDVPTPYHTLTEYDTQSIMHFHDRAYSINGGATIASLIPGLLIDPSDTLSLLDKMKLRLAFGHECNKRKVDNLFMSCKNSLLEEGNVNDAIANDGSDGGTASGSDGGTASGSDGGTASGGDRGTAGGSDRGTSSGSDAGDAEGSDGGNESGSDKGTATTAQRLKGGKQIKTIPPKVWDEIKRHPEFIKQLDKGTATTPQRLKGGAEIATIPPKVWEEIKRHPEIIKQLDKGTATTPQRLKIVLPIGTIPPKVMKKIKKHPEIIKQLGGLM